MAEAPSPPLEENGAEPSRPRVLVVDDVPYMLELAALFLGRTSIVVTARNGEEALAAARAERPDVIVSDRRMPGMDGVELCRTLGRDPELASVPFVMLVADDTGVARGQAIRAGANDVLLKPLSRLALIDSVTRLARPVAERGLPRIELEVPVNVTASHRGSGGREITGTDVSRTLSDEHALNEEKGVVRNLSRGGLFVETPCELAGASEVDLQFRLPGSPDLFTPSALVVWRRRAQIETPGRHETVGTPAGLGLRFLEVDAASLEQLADYVYERAPAEPNTTPPRD